MFRLKPDEEILDIMMEDAIIQKEQFPQLDKETIRKVLEGKGNQELRNILVKESSSGEGKSAGQEFVHRGSIKVQVSKDKMTAQISFLKNGELEQICEQDIYDALQMASIKTGIKKNQIKRLVTTPIYDKLFVVAKGILPVSGGQDDLKLYFEHGDKHRISVDSKTKIDYKEIGNILSVKEGAILCEWNSRSSDVEGKDVYGNTVSPKKLSKQAISPGKNVKYSVDKCQLIATCDGQVTFKGNIVSVDRVLELDNVDAATGNIRFIGTVNIKGNICEGYTVKATQNINVGDSIQNAKLVSAGNDIVVKRGIIGGLEGEIIAEGNLIANFIENAHIRVKKNIIADVIMTSRVECDGRIKLEGKKGSLLGGHCVARELDVIRIGNDTYTRSEIEIKLSDEIKEEMEKQHHELEKLEHSIHQKQELLELLMRSENNTKRAVEVQSEMLQTIYKKNAAKLKVEELEEQIQFIEKEYRSQVLIKEKMYPNIKVKIGDAVFINQELSYGGRLFYDGEEIIVGIRP